MLIRAYKRSLTALIVIALFASVLVSTGATPAEAQAITSPSSTSATSSIIDGNPREGEPARGEARERLGMIANLTGEQRAERFSTNQVQLNEMLDALPDQPESASQVEEIEILAFEQAKLLLNIQPSERSDLWNLWRTVNNGIPATVYFEGPNGGNGPTCIQQNLGGRNSGSGDCVYVVDTGGKTSNLTVVEAPPAFTPWGESFNSASRSERLAYLGFDEFGWELAEPYIELSYEMDQIQDDLENWIRPLLTLVAVVAIGAITAGIGASAYAAVFGVAADGFAAVTFGAVLSSYGTTLFITGSTAQAEKQALLTALTAGLLELTNVPIASRPNHVKITIALLEGGIASLSDQDFKQAFLLSLSEQYLPGVASFVEQLDNTSPFLVDLGVELVDSYIRHDGEWSLIAGDLENHFLEEAGQYVSNYVGDQLPDSWGQFGSHLGELAGIAVTSGGDPDTIREEVAKRLGQLTELGIGNVLGNEESIIASITGHLVTTAIIAEGLDEEFQAAFIDLEMTTFIFDLAGEEISSAAEGFVVRATGGQPNQLATSTLSLIDVAVSNLWRDRDELEEIVLDQLSQELQGAITAQFPGCAPVWALQLGDQIVEVVLDGALLGSADTIAADVSALLTQTSETGFVNGNPDLGTCHLGVEESQDTPPVCATPFVERTPAQQAEIDSENRREDDDFINVETGGAWFSVERVDEFVRLFYVDLDGVATVAELEEDPENPGGFRLSHRHFEVRESRNTDLPTSLGAAISSPDWRELPSDKAIFHDDPNTPCPERKFIHEDGREAVYYPSSGNLVTDPRYRGSYNFVNPAAVNAGLFEKIITNTQHVWFDVVPWLFGGNVRGPEPGSVGNNDCNGPCDTLDVDGDLIPAWLDLDDHDPRQLARYPLCTFAATTDSDNPRFGWENDATCANLGAPAPTPPATNAPTVPVPAASTPIAIASPAEAPAAAAPSPSAPTATASPTVAASPAAAPTATSGTSNCSSASVDSDGDGWGFENGRSCIVVQSVTNPATTSPTATERPTCSSAAADPDGDGWGFENGRSCIV